MPTGERAAEAATYFWYVTPRDTERWMGPALTRENVGAVNSILSEQQLALLAMTRQPHGATSQQSASKGIFLIPSASDSGYRQLWTFLPRPMRHNPYWLLHEVIMLCPERS